MLRLIIILILGTALSACNLIENDPEDKSIPTLEGTDPNGTEITFISQNGYHAIRINEQQWLHAENSVQLTNLSDSDNIEVVELCEENEGSNHSNGFIREWNVEQIANATDETGQLSISCYYDGIYIKQEEKAATLRSQQENSGISILDAQVYVYRRSSYDVETGTLSIELDSNFESGALIVTGYDKFNNNYYIFRQDDFSFNDGDQVTIDFFSENAEVAQKVALSNSDYRYMFGYCEGRDHLCINLKFDFNGDFGLIMPDNLKGSEGFYWEYWSYSHYQHHPHARAFTSFARNPIFINPLKSIQSNLPEFSFFKDQELWLKLPVINDFANKGWNLYTRQNYEGFYIWPDFEKATNAEKAKISFLDLSTLPNVPDFFNKTLSEMQNATVHLSGYSGEEYPFNYQDLSLYIPIPEEFIEDL